MKENKSGTALKKNNSEQHMCLNLNMCMCESHRFYLLQNIECNEGLPGAFVSSVDVFRVFWKREGEESSYVTQGTSPVSWISVSVHPIEHLQLEICSNRYHATLLKELFLQPLVQRSWKVKMYLTFSEAVTFVHRGNRILEAIRCYRQKGF